MFLASKPTQSMTQVPFYTVDAFTSAAFKGNPAAVCIFKGVSFLLLFWECETNPVWTSRTSELFVTFDFLLSRMNPRIMPNKNSLWNSTYPRRPFRSHSTKTTSRRASFWQPIKIIRRTCFSSLKLTPLRARRFCVIPGALHHPINFV